MKSHSIRASLALAVVCGLLLQLIQLLVFPAVARADDIPPLDRPTASLSDVPNAQRAFAHPEGGVSVGCGTNAPKAAVTFSGTGSISQSIGSPLQKLPLLCDDSVAGPDGAIYASAWDGNRSVLVAYQGGSLKWTYVPQCGLYPALRSLTFAPNGKLYMVIPEGCGNPQLLGVDPVPPQGQSSPNVVLQTTINAEVPSFGGLGVHQNGLVVRTTNGLRYYDFAGNEIAAVQSSLNLAPNNGYSVAVNSGGTTFVATKASSSKISECGGVWDIAGALRAYDSTGAAPQWSSAELSDCTRVYKLSPLPQGGVVAHVSTWPGGAAQATTQHLLAFGPSGQTLWTKTLPATDGNGGTYWGNASWAVDLGGNIAIQRELQAQHTVGGSQRTLPSVQLQLISGNTGIQLVNRTVAGDPNSGYGYRASTIDSSHLAIGKGVIYVPVIKCNDVYPCYPYGSQLLTIKMPGLGIDYPRGTLLGLDSPTRQYVAMGDSFSSGQGADDYMDSSECFRSHRAYSQLLAKNPALGLDLSTSPYPYGFVACGGAETQHITSEFKGQAPQVDALSSDTDVVTISVGGNDSGFKEFIAKCLFANCDTVKQEYLDKIDNLDLNSLYSQISAHAPNARVLVLGYPELLPNGQSCPYVNGTQQFVEWVSSFFAAIQSGIPSQTEKVRAALRSLGFLDAQINDIFANGGEVQLSSAEIDTAQEFTAALNAKISDAVSEQSDSRIDFVDLQIHGSPFEEHQLCSTEPYFNGLDINEISNSFHPNKKGQDAYRQLIQRHL